MRRFSRQERGPADLVASAVAANFPLVERVRSPSSAGFHFHDLPFAAGHYSASAAVLKEEAT